MMVLGSMSSIGNGLWLCICFMVFVNSDAVYPQCTDDKPDDSLIRCMDQESGIKVYECRIRFQDECPDYDDESQKHPFWLKEKKPLLSHPVTPVTHHLLRRGFKICSYQKNCEDLTPSDCGFDRSISGKLYQSIHTNILPKHDDIAFTLYPQGLNNYKYMLPTKSDTDQHQKDLAYHLGDYHTDTDQDTLVIYFDGTGARMIDVRTDLAVRHITRRLKFADSPRMTSLRVHRGMATRLEANSFWTPLSNELVERYKDKQPPKKLVISGHSLGGGYAIWFYLMVFSEDTPLNVWRKREGMDIFRDIAMEDISVITYGAPFIIYYKDIYRIPPYVQARIFNFVDHKDPVPKSLAGVGRPLLRDMTITGMLRKLRVKERILELASNGPIGNYFVIYRDDGHVWIDLELKHDRAIRFGSICLWYQHAKSRHMRKAMTLAKETHVEDKYRTGIVLSLASEMGGMNALKDDPDNRYFEHWFEENEKFRKSWDTMKKTFKLMTRD